MRDLEGKGSRSERLHEVVSRARGLPVRAQASYLDEACAEDPELRSEAESMLSSQDTVESSLESDLASPAAMDLVEAEVAGPTTAPKRVGAYRIEDELGRGGMGVVYRGWDDKLGRPVAIKAIPDALAEQAQLCRRLEREARLLGMMSHPHIATLYGIEELDGRLYLILEYLDGETLAAELRRGALPLESTLKTCLRVAEALQSAHRRGVIHRDLKPGNIMRTAEGVVKVLDFGLAATLAGGKEGSIHRGTVLGTPGYMSPEQATGGEVGRATDLWSFGCVLFQCLTGHRLWRQTSSDFFAAVVREEADLSSLPEDLPPELKALVRLCQEKLPERRPQDMGEVVALLESALMEQSAGAGARPSPRPHPGNLRRELTSFVGRRDELVELRGLLDKTRLTTLTGVGGCGKTRLALELASVVTEDYPDGVWLVELGPLSAPELTGAAVARTLGVAEQAGRDIEETLVEHLAEKRLLLVLDNCEHLMDAASELAEVLLRGCGELTLVTTSREPLGVAGETTYLVGPLPEQEAEHLFLERAGSVSPPFAGSTKSLSAVREICGRLDGIPLAIELAATRLRVMTPDQIASRLDDRFRLLAGGGRRGLERHRTLRAAIDWSYELLSEAEQRLLGRLSVFSGGWRLESAEQVCSGDGLEEHGVLEVLAGLVAKSMVAVAESEQEVRYRLLETIREYAAECLKETGHAEHWADRHLTHYLDLAETANSELEGPEQGKWLTRLEDEIDNLRAALARAHDSTSAERELRLAGALTSFWRVRGHFSEGCRFLRAALERGGDEQAKAARAKLLGGAAQLYVNLGDYAEARRLAQESLETCRELDRPAGSAIALNILSRIECVQGNYAVARRQLEDALVLSRELDDARLTGKLLSALGLVSSQQGEHVTARKLLEESLAICRQRGDSGSIAAALINLGVVATDLGDSVAARGLYEEGLELSRALGHKLWTANVLGNLSNLWVREEDYDRARAYRQECLELQQELGNRRGRADALHALGEILIRQGDHAAARSLMEEGLGIFRELGDRDGAATVLLTLAKLASKDGDHALACSTLRESLELFRTLGSEQGLEQALARMAVVDITHGQSRRGIVLHAAAEKLRETLCVPLSPAACEEIERLSERARSALGDETHGELMAEGRAMTLDQVLDFALADDP